MDEKALVHESEGYRNGTSERDKKTGTRKRLKNMQLPGRMNRTTENVYKESEECG